MLEFFRKYQRYFFIFVTVVIIVTFSLFGSYKTFGQAEGRKEIVVGRAIDGSKLKYFEIKQLAALLGAESGKTSIVSNEFLKTGIGEELAQAYFESLTTDWQSRLDRTKRCRFYVHPTAPFLNAQEIWKQLAPGAIDELHALREMSNPTPAFFSSWTRLFWLQEHCPGELIKRVLLYHQNQYQITPDPHLFSEDCSLVGLHGAGEWFGSQFMDLVAQFILNAAIMAEEKGFHVTRAETEADLVNRFSSKERNLDMVLRSIGVSRNDAIRLWERVTLFNNYFQMVGQATLLDDLSYRQFSDFAHQSALIEVYDLPQELRLKSLDDFLSFEIYQRLACVPCDFLDCPNSLLSAAEVAKRAPELVYAKYRLKCAQIDLKTIESRLSMREVWNWQIEPLNWAAIKLVFPEIVDSSVKHPFQVLEKLDPIRRSAIDAWSRKQIVKAHPEWIEKELSDADTKDHDLYIFANGDIEGLGIDQVARFQSLLDRAVDGDVSALESLKAYQEKDAILRISQINIDSKRTIISFADAKKMNRISIDRFLEEEYYLRREQSPSLFQNETGEFRLLSDIKEILVFQIFAPLFRAMDREMPDNEGTLAFYIQHRFDPWMKQALASLQAGKDLRSNDLWPIEHSERTITRTSSEDWIMKQPFILKTDQWSDVYVPPDGEIVFFFVKERKNESAPILEQIQQGKQTLSANVKCLLAKQLLDIAIKKQAIVLPLTTGQEIHDDL